MVYLPNLYEIGINFMKDLLLYPDVFLVGVFSLAFLSLTFVLSKFKSSKQFIVSLLLAFIFTPISLFIHSQKFCGTEICFYHGWPHFLYISYGSPTFDVMQTLRFPIYFLINSFFYFSLFSLVEILMKKMNLRTS